MDLTFDPTSEDFRRILLRRLIRDALRTVDQILQSRKIKAELTIAFSLSGHRTENQQEQGGWIYQNRKGGLEFIRADSKRATAGRIDLTNPPTLRGATLVATYHTHPYSERDANTSLREGFNSMRASQRDEELAFKAGIPDLVVYERDYPRNGQFQLRFQR